METNLQEVLNKINERIVAIDKFNTEEADFGRFMLSHYTKCIPVSEVAKFVFVDGTLAFQGLAAMKIHFTNWISYIDKEISKTNSILSAQTIE